MKPEHTVAPIYPAQAEEMRIQGTVELRAVAGEDGNIWELTVVTGYLLLAHAAVNAVRQ